MASAVDICNLALANIGDEATVAALDPPEGSAQAARCARFYPLARDSVLEMHSWNFATRRAVLAEVTNTWPQWQFAYAKPTDCLKTLAVLSSEATSDYEAFLSEDTIGDLNLGGFLAPQRYVSEVSDAGTSVILTNQEDAMLRYVALVTDTTKFSPMFIQALSWYLAAMLAGPVIKGDVGIKVAERCLARAQTFIGFARATDTEQRDVRVTHSVSWIGGR